MPEKDLSILKSSIEKNLHYLQAVANLLAKSGDDDTYELVQVAVSNEQAAFETVSAY